LFLWSIENLQQPEFSNIPIWFRKQNLEIAKCMGRYETEMIEMAEGIVETNVLNWREEVLESEKLVLIEFWSPQCPHCRMIEPVYNELAKEYADKLKFAEFNVIESQSNQELAVKYGVMGTPTFKFFCGGRPVQDVVGALPKEYLKQAIDFAIKKHRECAEKSTPLKLPYIR